MPKANTTNTTKIDNNIELKKIETDKEVEKIDYKDEYEKLKNDFEELKAMMIMSSNKQKEVNSSKESDEYENNEDAPIIPSNKMINVTNLFYGQLYLQGVNKFIDFPTFGVTLPMTFEDLSHAQSVARSFAEDGHFYINNKDAVKILYLEDHYKKFIKKDKIINILKLSDTQIEDLINNTTNTLKKTIEDMIIDGLVKDEALDYQHKKFTDKTKIVFIGKLLRKDLIGLAKKMTDNNEDVE